MLTHFPVQLCNDQELKKTRRGLEHRNSFWNRYWACASQLLAILFSLSLGTVPEVFANVN